MLEAGKYFRKVDENYGKIGDNHSRERNYLCAGRG